MKYLEVIVDQSLSVSSQCVVAVKKANRPKWPRVLSISLMKLLTLYSTLIRPHFDYCVQFCEPHYKKDIEALEKVPRRATGLNSCIKDELRG